MGECTLIINSEQEEGGEQAGPEGQGEQGVSSACDLFASEQSL